MYVGAGIAPARFEFATAVAARRLEAPVGLEPTIKRFAGAALNLLGKEPLG